MVQARPRIMAFERTLNLLRRRGILVVDQHDTVVTR
jgi:acetolactate synthase regulatory subunit